MKNTHHPSRKRLILIVAAICVLSLGTCLTACGMDPVETLPPPPYSEAYEKLLAIEGVEQYDPAVLEAFARRIEEEEGVLETYTEVWTLEQDGTCTRLTCVAPLTDDYKRSTFKLIHDGKTLYVDAITKEDYPDAYTENLHRILCSAKGSNQASSRVKKDFLEFLLACDWFPDSAEWEQYQTNCYYSYRRLPEETEDKLYVTLFIELREADSAPDEPYILCSIYHDGNNAKDRTFEEINSNAEVTVPPTTEPVPTEPPTPFVKEESPAYQKLLTLPNAEHFLCNRFEVNELAVFAEWIDSLEGITDTYSGQWYLKHYGDDGAGLVCHTPLEEDNSCDYIKFTLWYGGEIITDPDTGRRYFTDIPRTDIAELVYGAHDPIGVDDSIKELFIDYILYCDTFAWSILDPTFRSEWYYEIVTMWPYPKLEPDNHYDQLRLCVDVWRPGMAEDDRYHFWLTYDEDWNQVGLGYQVEGDYHKMVLTGVISED